MKSNILFKKNQKAANLLKTKSKKRKGSKNNSGDKKVKLENLIAIAPHSLEFIGSHSRSVRASDTRDEVV